MPNCTLLHFFQLSQPLSLVFTSVQFHHYVFSNFFCRSLENQTFLEINTWWKQVTAASTEPKTQSFFLFYRLFLRRNKEGIDVSKTVNCILTFPSFSSPDLFGSHLFVQFHHETFIVFSNLSISLLEIRLFLKINTW